MDERIYSKNIIEFVTVSADNQSKYSFGMLLSEGFECLNRIGGAGQGKFYIGRPNLRIAVHGHI